MTADLAKVLGNREELALKYYEINNREREKDQIAVFIAKQQYLMRDKPQNYILTAEDSSRIVGMPMQDSLFIAYLKTLTDTTRLYSVPERCRLLVTEPELSRISESTVLKRNQSFINEMVYVHGVDSLRLIKMPYDSLTPAVDTFELFGPRYEFRFDMAGDSLNGPSE